MINLSISMHDMLILKLIVRSIKIDCGSRRRNSFDKGVFVIFFMVVINRPYATIYQRLFDRIK